VADAHAIIPALRAGGYFGVCVSIWLTIFPDGCSEVFHYPPAFSGNQGVQLEIVHQSAKGAAVLEYVVLGYFRLPACPVVREVIAQHRRHHGEKRGQEPVKHAVEVCTNLIVQQLLC
jgi:hypothetical protein